MGVALWVEGLEPWGHSKLPFQSFQIQFNTVSFGGDVQMSEFLHSLPKTVEQLDSRSKRNASCHHEMLD